MNTIQVANAKAASKAHSGITGFDEITGGGLPRSRTTLLVGGPGSGKTIFAMQFLVHRAERCNEPGIFVAFEERPDRIVANFESFGGKLTELRRKKLFFLDAEPAPDLIQSGDFDLGGMLAVLGAKAKEMGARRIVFDALDILLTLLPDHATRRREVYRLHAWLLTSGMTGLITAKDDSGEINATSKQPFGFMQFMVDCAVVLNHRVMLGVSQRDIRVQKYRGSAFDENESPFLIGKNGFEVAVSRSLGRGVLNVSKERLSRGVARRDTMLGGGYYRGACVLITGLPGTAKTTLGGAFAEAACKRSERTLFVSFDAESNEVVRDLASVSIQLDRQIKSGQLRMISARTVTGSAETFLVRIKAFAKEHQAQCVVIDPVSTWSKSGNGVSTHSVTERLIDWSKAEGMTLFCTSLMDEVSNQNEPATANQISMLADTWIHLDYLVQAGERNRSLSIIKSRGMAHSNQVRELILSNSGVTLADIYSAGGEVLMGTLRWEKESAERVAADVTEVAEQLKRVRLDAEEAELEVRVKSLQVELVAKQVEKALLVRTAKSREGELSRDRTHVDGLRGADAVIPMRKGSR